MLKEGINNTVQEGSKSIGFNNKYKKCPRCELNYILIDEVLCMICEKEKKGILEEEESEYCPFCGIRKVEYSADMCEECRLMQEMEYRGLH